MWWLAFIPDEWLHLFIHGVAALGVILSVVGGISKNIPFIAPYGTIAKALGGIVLLVGVFFEGGYGVEMSYRAKIEEMQAKINEAVAKSEDANAKLDSQVKQDVKVIHDTQVVIQEKIVHDAAQIDATCTVDPVAIEDLNAAARGGKK